MKAGDVVQLKSGGNWMTVQKFDGHHFHCVWAEAGDIREAFIRPCLLRRRRWWHL